MGKWRLRETDLSVHAGFEPRPSDACGHGSDRKQMLPGDGLVI